MRFDSQQKVLDALRQLPKGSARSDILRDKRNRSLVLTTGANVMLYCGKAREAGSAREKLSDIHVAVLNRRNPQTGEPDGLGNLGGLSERTNPFAFYHLSLDEKIGLVGKKDDVILVNDTPILTKDMDIICRNNILREAREELSDLGIEGVHLETKDIKSIPLPGLKDDNFIANIWDGNGTAYAVNPYCHMLEIDEGLMDFLQERSLDSSPKKDAEVSAITKHSLFDVLSRPGDYRYAHEWFATWVIASKMLNHNPEELVKLAEEVYYSSNRPVGFEATIRKMAVNPSILADALHIDVETFEQMRRAMLSYNESPRFLTKQMYHSWYSK